MATNVTIVKTGDTRVFLIENRAGPANAPEYMLAARAMAPSRAYGDITPIQLPSPHQWDQFDDIDQIKGARARVSFPIQARYLPSISRFLTLAETGCTLDLQVPIGNCKDPRDLNLGWSDKKIIVEDWGITQYGLSELGALQDTDRASVLESIEGSARNWYEIKRLAYAETAASEVVNEVMDIKVCDAVTCGVCGVSSDGCQVVFAIIEPQGGSPGLGAQLLWTEDAGATWDSIPITGMGATETPSRLACVGDKIAVVSNEALALFWTYIADVLAGTATWNEVAGFAAGDNPNAIFSVGSQETWVVGNGGSIYKVTDPTVTTGYVLQGDGITTQNLNDIHGVDAENLVAVGASNAVVYTRNGGTTWTSVTGPAVGVVLNSVFMRSTDEWWITTAGGQLWYTIDSGTTWTQKTFSGSGAGNARHVVFTTDSVGFLSHDTAANVARIFRTDDGGYSWYRDSDATNVGIPTATRFNRLAVCDSAAPQTGANVVYAAGIKAASDGIVVKGS